MIGLLWGFLALWGAGVVMAVILCKGHALREAHAVHGGIPELMVILEDGEVEYL